MSNNSLKVPNARNQGGVFTNVATGLLAIFLIFGWPILAVFLMMSSASSFKSAPRNTAPKAKQTDWKFYMGLTMMIIWAIMIMFIGSRFM
jgi:hypothetical protein